MTSSTPAAQLTDLLTAAAAQAGERPGLVGADGTVLTWSELDRTVTAVASGLLNAGLVGGQRVMIALENRLEFPIAYWAILRAQLIAVPVDPSSDGETIARLLADSGARAVFVSDRSRAAVNQAAPEGVRVIDEAGLAELSNTPPVELIAAPDPEKLAALLYTSGTTGLPRGAMLTHRAFLANIEQGASIEPPLVRPDDVVLGLLPLFHVYGLNAVLGAVLRQQGTLLVVDDFDPGGTLELIERAGVTVLPVAPGAITRWLAGFQERLTESLDSVRLVFSGSAPLAADAAERFTELTGLAVQQGYGLTEGAPVITSTLATEHPGATLGPALTGIELQLREESGEVIEPGSDADAGELWIRGDNLFSGYWPDGSDAPETAGWWATGDVAMLDEAGNLTLVDRVTELITVSGFAVYPTEIEAVIAEVPGVAGVAVLGVPDEHTGQQVVAQLRAAAHADPDLLAHAVLEHCQARLARFKVPTRIDLVAELPLTPTGKVQRGRVRRRTTQLLG